MTRPVLNASDPSLGLRRHPAPQRRSTLDHDCGADHSVVAGGPTPGSEPKPPVIGRTQPDAPTIAGARQRRFGSPPTWRWEVDEHGQQRAVRWDRAWPLDQRIAQRPKLTEGRNVAVQRLGGLRTIEPLDRETDTCEREDGARTRSPEPHQLRRIGRWRSLAHPATRRTRPKRPLASRRSREPLGDARSAPHRRAHRSRRVKRLHDRVLPLRARLDERRPGVGELAPVSERVSGHLRAVVAAEQLRARRARRRGPPACSLRCPRRCCARPASPVTRA